MMTRALVVVVLVAVAEAPARAGTPTVVFPLAASGVPADTAAAMTRALAASIDGRVAKVPIDDPAELLACDVETTTCLERVASSLGARRLVFGTVARAGDGPVKVTLTRFDVGPAREQRTFELAAATPDALADELVRASAPLFATARPAPPPEPRDRPAPRQTHGRRITAATWAFIGGGLVVTAVGTGFLISANNLREEVANAPKATDADFERLVALEDRGRRRAYTGDALVIAGGAVMVFGIVRAVISKRSSGREQALRIVPVRSGAAVVLEVVLP